MKMEKLRNLMGALALGFAGLSALPEDGLRVEMSPAQVRMVLGEPAGSLAQGDASVWVYPRGSVRLVDERVVSWHFQSPEVLAAEVRYRQELLVMDRQAAERALAELIDSEAPLAWRVERLADLHRRYPDLGAGPLLRHWRAELTQQRERVATQTRLDELEERLQAAEQEAAQARREARQNRRGHAVSAFGYRASGPGFDHNARRFWRHREAPQLTFRDEPPTGRTGPIEDVTPEFRPGFTASLTTNAVSFEIEVEE